MRYDRMMRLAVPLIAACAVLLPYSAVASPQDTQAPQDQSVADAARQAREKKKAAKASKVISDDDIDNKNLKPGGEGLNVGSAPASDAVAPSAAAVSADETSDRKAAAAEDVSAAKHAEDPELAKAKAEVAEAAQQLSLLQRGFALDQDTYYSKPSYTDDHDGKSKLDAEQQQINDKQQDLDRLKAHLAELEEARKNKKDASGETAGSSETEKPAEPPAPPTPPQL